MCGHAFKCQVHGLHSHHLAKTRLAIQAQQHAVVDPHGHIGAGVETAFQNGIHIARGHAHAVRVVPAQVGQHQIGCHLARPIGRCASVDKQTGDGVFQFGGGNQVTHGGWGGGLAKGGMGGMGGVLRGLCPMEPVCALEGCCLPGWARPKPVTSPHPTARAQTRFAHSRAARFCWPRLKRKR